MKTLRCCGWLWLASLPGAGWAQAPTATPHQTLQRAQRAAGAWDQVTSLAYTSTRRQTDPWQAYSFTRPAPTTITRNFAVDRITGRYRTRAVYQYPGGYAFDFVTVGRDSTVYLYDRTFTRNGKALLQQGAPSYRANQGAATQGLPYYLVKSVLASGDTLRQDDTPAGPAVWRRLPNGSRQELLFDPATGRLAKLTVTTSAERTERHFERYATVDGLAVPRRVRQVVKGGPYAVEKLTAVAPNTPLDPAAFAISPAYQPPAPAPPQALAAQEIAPDVYLVAGVGGDRNVVFVNMTDYVVVTEAPLAPPVTKAVLELIHRTLPGKRIGYVHLSHHHNDHLAGVRQWVAEGATLLCTPPLEAPVRAVLNGELGRFADDYAQNPKEPVFEFFTGVKVLDDGRHRLELHALPNSHAEGMSFLYLPAAGLLYECDLLSVPADGTLTPAIAVNREFSRYLKAKRLPYTRIVGHHDHAAITPAMFATILHLK
jgi:glyoxylase-like metal-dependent hydrolase (beta-lactamase superfamily II)